MKILWLSSVQLSDNQVLCSGTWIPGLLSLMKSHYPNLEYVNITKGKVSKPQCVELEYIREWIIPDSKKMFSKTISYIKDIIVHERPDLIQVWGTEDIWGLFPFKELTPNIPTILEIQGILASVSEEYYGGLTPMEVVRCWNIKEWIKPTSSLPAIRKSYTRNIERERLILKSFDNIGVQSGWSASVVKSFNPDAKLYKSGIALRPEFYTSEKWIQNKTHSPIIFSTALMGQPLKGAYILFKAFALVKQQFPNAQLYMGGVKEEGIRRGGFCRMLLKYAKKQGFADSIFQLGKMSAKQLAQQYREASVFVNPSNWESYSVVTAEAMYIGCPTVAAYSGAMPELGVDGSVLYFPKGDHRICASHIISILKDQQFASTLSEKAIKVAKYRQDISRIAENQLSIYKNLISNS